MAIPPTARTPPNGKKYDLSYSVNLLQSVRLYDTVFNDEDQRRTTVHGQRRPDAVATARMRHHRTSPA
jgi:hypothetical protein